jgi:hypothetical protein
MLNSNSSNIVTNHENNRDMYMYLNDLKKIFSSFKDDTSPENLKNIVDKAHGIAMGIRIINKKVNDTSIAAYLMDTCMQFMYSREVEKYLYKFRRNLYSHTINIIRNSTSKLDTNVTTFREFRYNVHLWLVRSIMESQFMLEVDDLFFDYDFLRKIAEIWAIGKIDPKVIENALRYFQGNGIGTYLNFIMTVSEALLENIWSNIDTNNTDFIRSILRLNMIDLFDRKSLGYNLMRVTIDKMRHVESQFYDYYPDSEEVRALKETIKNNLIIGAVDIKPDPSKRYLCPAAQRLDPEIVTDEEDSEESIVVAITHTIIELLPDRLLLPDDRRTQNSIEEDVVEG